MSISSITNTASSQFTDFQDLQNLSSIPFEELSKRSDGLKLWETTRGELCATLLNPERKLIFVSPSQMINSCGKGFTFEAISFIKTHLSSFDFIYRNYQVIVLPRLMASGKDEISSSITIEERIEEWSPPQLSKRWSKLGHIFRNANGHFSKDTQENRAFIALAVSRPENRVAVDNYGKEIYLKTLPDGIQIWVYVERGIITNAGYNRNPMRWAADSAEERGGKLVPLMEGASVLEKTEFVRRIQFNRLATTYNSTHGKQSIHPHLIEVFPVEIPSSIPQVESEKGVGHATGLILNLLGELKRTEYSGEHLFFIPIPDDGSCLEENEMLQILRELAQGIYLYDALPFISLELNPEGHAYPVIHPAYQNTLIGHTIAMLDYYMKGIAHGKILSDQFIQEWNRKPVSDDKLFKENCLDFKLYCQQCLGEEVQTYDEIFASVEKQFPSSNREQRINIEGRNISFRIIGKQNSIRQTDNLFILEGDFDVEYSIGTSFISKTQEQITEQTCDLMTQQIKRILPRIPELKKSFTVLYLTNFFAYYFNTLKEADKIPQFSRDFLPGSKQVCPSLFPLIPDPEANSLHFKLGELVKSLPPEKRKMLINGLQQKGAKNQESHLIAALKEVLKQYAQWEAFTNLSEETYHQIATTLWNACQGRYENTKRSADTTMLTMGIKTNPSEQLSAKEVGQRMDRLMQRLDNDILKTQKVIETKRKRGLSYSEELAWISDWQDGKRDIAQYKPILEKWVLDPLASILDGCTLSFNLSTHDLSITKDRVDGRSSFVGGASIYLHDQVAKEYPNGYNLLKGHHSILSGLPYEKLLEMQEGSSSLGRGMVFKLSFADLNPFPEEFGPVEVDPIQAAFGHLVPPQPDYPFSEEILTLYFAISTKNQDLFMSVADAVQDWNFQYPSKVRLIHYAASAKDPLFLREVIKRGADPLLVDSQGYTALHYAAKNGCLANIDVLIATAPSLLNTRSINGETPLYSTTQYAQIGSIRALMEAKADPNIPSKSGINPLMTALYQGDESVALELLSFARSLDLNYQLRDRTAAVHLAIQMRLGNTLQRLLEEGANGDQALRDGHKPIHLAIIQGWLEGVKILANAPGVYLDVRTGSGHTPLQLAIQYNQQAIITFLQGDRGMRITRIVEGQINPSRCLG